MNEQVFDKIAPALVKAQAEISPAVPMDGTNPYYKSRYATLGAVISATRDILAKHGLSVIQQVISNPSGDAVGIRTMILHESGQSMSWDCNVKIKPGYTKTMTERNGEKKIKVSYDTNPGQEAGKLITYLRRYSLAAALNLYADEDIDANSPSQQNGNGSGKRSQPKPKPLTLDEAAKVCNHDGVPYVELDEDRLSHMSRSINEAIKSNGHDQKRLAELQTKQQAIKTILTSRAG